MTRPLKKTTDESVNVSKVVSLAILAQQAEWYRRQGLSVVLCHGTFDLLHIGHIRHLQQARGEGHRLLVTITADDFVEKGPGRPVFNQNLRAEQISALADVDAVAINYATTSVNVIHKIKPDAYIKGSDYKENTDDVTGNIVLERHAVESHGGRIVYTDEITFSSSHLINEHFDIFPRQIKNYLAEIKQRYTASDIINIITEVQKLKILIVGESIIDEYHYTSPLGQSGKYDVLAVQYQNQERFAGGSIAVANHIAGYTDAVTLFTGLGMNKVDETYIVNQLKPNVDAQFLYFPKAPTIVKRRYIGADMAKLFEVYFYDECPLDAALEADACGWLEQHVADYDVVIVPDFGNGFISENMIEVLTNQAKFLAVNTQINSGNRGFHVITRYPRADFISLNEPELRLSAHSRYEDIEAIASRIADDLSARYIAITRGTKGVMVLDREAGTTNEVPALSTKVIDRIGAGDAFLAIAGGLLGAGKSSEVAAFVGSVAAALDVQIVCNRESIEAGALFKYITTLLK